MATLGGNCRVLCAVIAKDNADEILQLLRSVEPFERALYRQKKSSMSDAPFVVNGGFRSLAITMVSST